jgi:hypothetical protein
LHADLAGALPARIILALTSNLPPVDRTEPGLVDRTIRLHHIKMIEVARRILGLKQADTTRRSAV